MGGQGVLGLSLGAVGCFSAVSGQKHILPVRAGLRRCTLGVGPGWSTELGGRPDDPGKN